MKNITAILTTMIIVAALFTVGCSFQKAESGMDMKSTPMMEEKETMSKHSADKMMNEDKMMGSEKMENKSMNDTMKKTATDKMM